MERTGGPAVRRLWVLARQAATLVASGECEATTAAALLALVDEVRDLADKIGDGAVRVLREAGWSWAQIGRVTGVTRQAAQQRWGVPDGDDDTTGSGEVSSGR